MQASGVLQLDQWHFWSDDITSGSPEGISSHVRFLSHQYHLRVTALQEPKCILNATFWPSAGSFMALLVLRRNFQVT